ncbi:MAG: HD domain-containing protein [Planctomycetaceae bacterium]
MTVIAEQYDDFFAELWGYRPFPWQQRLAKRVCEGDWPRFIDLPTASGKTACLDVAVFAMAVQAARESSERTVGRRIFFVVNRRVIVDEAYQRAEEIGQKLLCALHGEDDARFRCCEREGKRVCADGTDMREPPCWKRPALIAVANALQQVSGDTSIGTPPLDVAMLRGGIVRDNRWARSITQPTIITSTLDQVGSRLLFRGYGVSPEAAPVHAALIVHDSTILLDEAHISQPFVETLEAVQKYRGEDWAEQPVHTPFHFVQMTATPGNVPDADVFRLDDADRLALHDRHGNPKPIQLNSVPKAKGKKAIPALAAEITSKAVELQDGQHQNVAVVVNRIATAREVYCLLQKRFAPRKPKTEPAAQVELAIGRMRPLDRDILTKRIQQRVGKTRSDADDHAKPMYVVATQCLEVGADFDFDAMVSECASLDALRQRFGRLNRTGRDIEATGCIVIRGDQIQTVEQLAALDMKNEQDDPIYGNALARTWNWLQSTADDGRVDFGVNAMNAALTGVDDDDVEEMLARRPKAPVMFPAYMDIWAQSNPFPVPSPDVALFLHGPNRGEPDVNVCWRDDLTSDNPTDWPAIVSLCPPSSPECMTVPIGVVRRWLVDRQAAVELDDERSDLLDGQAPESDDAARSALRPALSWRGVERSEIIRHARQIKPGDTIVLPSSEGGWDVFGHLPDPKAADIAERAYQQTRGRAILRLRPEHLQDWPQEEAIDELRGWLRDAELTLRHRELRTALEESAHRAPEGATETAALMLELATRRGGLKHERYPDGVGVVLETRRRQSPRALIPAMDDGEDESSRVVNKKNKPVPLDEHLAHVRSEVDKTQDCLPIVTGFDAVGPAADLHDLGKADNRFQALLIDGDLHDVGAQRKLWAKSARKPSSRVSSRAAFVRSRLPKGFRHEMLSVQLAETLSNVLPNDPADRELVLHLIAAHHGRARPFAPVVIDDAPEDVELELHGFPASITAEYRREHPVIGRVRTGHGWAR